MSLRIWILNHHALPPSMPGGTRHFDFAKVLVSMGHEVTIFASSFHYATLKETKDYGSRDHIIEVIEDVKFIWIRTPSYQANDFRRIFNMIAYYRKVLSLGKQMEQQPDIIIGSTVHPLAPLAAAKLADFYAVPFIYEIRDLWPQTFIDIGVWKEKGLQSRIFRWLEKKAFHHAVAIIALSPLTVEYLDQKYGKKQIQYLPNGVNLERFDHPPANVGNHPTIGKVLQLRSAGKFIIMFTGAIVISNKIETILEAAVIIAEKGLDEISIVLIGGGQDKKRMLNKIKSSKLKNISILDPVSKEEVSGLLELADALLLVQGKVFYGSTNKLADYMAASKPLLTAISVRHNDPVDKIACGLSVNPEDAKDMARGMIAMYQYNDSEREEMGLKGRAYAEQNLSIQILGQQLEQLCASLVEKN